MAQRQLERNWSSTTDEHNHRATSTHTQCGQIGCYWSEWKRCFFFCKKDHKSKPLRIFKVNISHHRIQLMHVACTRQTSVSDFMVSISNNAHSHTHRERECALTHSHVHRIESIYVIIYRWNCENTFDFFFHFIFSIMHQVEIIWAKLRAFPNEFASNSHHKLRKNISICIFIKKSLNGFSGITWITDKHTRWRCFQSHICN